MYTITCVGCGSVFEATNARRKRCDRNCGRSSQYRNSSRTTRRKVNERVFIGVDGEGVTRPTGEHIYDMLGVGDEVLTHPEGGQLEFRDVCEFLYQQYEKNPNAIFVGFFLGYDFIQWFRTLPEERARMLLTKEGIAKRQRKTHQYLGPFPVQYGGFEFDMLGMKRFKLRRQGDSGYMYINDTGSYFACSFLSAIDPKKWPEPIVTDEEFRIISEGKADRGRRMTLEEQFENRAATEQYNGLENKVLARMMSKLNEGLTQAPANVRLKKDQWYGPGQAAQQWLAQITAPGTDPEEGKMAALTTDAANMLIPQTVLDAAQASYFGGWFEIFAHGHVPGISYEYDINSAYPSVQASLPCLRHGTWYQGGRFRKPKGDGKYRLVHAEVWGDDPVCGTMLHRSTKQAIMRPHHTKGWYWWSEMEAAIRAGVISKYKIFRWFEYDPCDCPPPFSEAVPLIYNKRLEAGKNSPEGMAFKVVYNSSYGKHVQSIGKPKYSNSVYGSLFTSGCRTMILNAIATHPTKTASLLMVATDGVYFKEPHPGLEISPTELGKWDMAKKENLTLFMPGLYWDDKTRNNIREGKNPSLKSRGISATDLVDCIFDLDRQFDKLSDSGVWPEVVVPVKFSMISCVQALARGKWHLAGSLVWEKGSGGTKAGSKTIKASPISKRHPINLWKDEYGIVRSDVYEVDENCLENLPYDKTFGRDEEQVDLQGLGLSPDGYNTDQFSWMMRGE